MFNKIKANREIDTVFALAEEAANLPMPVPTFIKEVRFELLFFFFFLLDYRKFHKLNQSLRKAILDTFLKRVSTEVSGERSKYITEVLYEKRMAGYFEMIENARKTRDFLMPASEYIEATALYLMEKGHFSLESTAQIDIVRQEINPKNIGKLVEPIQISISMHSLALL